MCGLNQILTEKVLGVKIVFVSQKSYSFHSLICLAVF